jgi:hypothetical protein
MQPTNPPGWYPDPTPGAPAGRHRYWTGRAWTEHTSQATTIPEPGARAGHGRRRWILLSAIGLVVVGLVLVGVFALTSSSSKSYPKAWDAQVKPIADQVAALRGLSFEHPVPVRYLSDQAFRKEVGVDDTKLTPAARKRVKNLEGTLRAFGLIDADTDLVKSFSAEKESGVLAYYDPQRQEIVIRGTGPLDVERKATLAHELTHVLQDQHFDLEQLEQDAADSKAGTTNALKALVEGDAERIKFAYLKKLPQADQDAYDAAEDTTSSGIEDQTTDVAEIVKIELGAPYTFGPLALRVITAHGGNRAVDEALQRPAPTDAIFLDPSDALKAQKVVTVAKPVLKAGEKQLGPADQLGAFDLYTVLASRIDRQTALNAADTWAGDRVVTYTANDQTCVRTTIASATTDGAKTMAGALNAWAATMPGATVTTDLERKRSTLNTCDSGQSRAPDGAKLEAAMTLVGARSGFLAELLSEGAPVDLSVCVSNGIVKTPLFVSLVDRNAQSLTAAEKSQVGGLVSSLAEQCRAEAS